MLKATRRVALISGLCAMLLGGTAVAQNYPDRNIHVVVPYGASSGLDVVMRSLAESLSKELGVSMVIENRAGSNGQIGTQAVARAPADGYTLLATTQSHFTGGMLQDDLPYNPESFIPIARFAASQLVMVAAADASFQGAKELIEQGKKPSNELSYASLGRGSSAHSAGVLFNELAGVKLLHVPYKESSQSLTDTLSGQTSITFVAMPAARAQVDAGRAQAVAVTGVKRSPSLPDVPTLVEVGLDGYDITAWYGLFAPQGTPPEAVEKLSASVMKVVATSEFQDMLARMGLEPRADDAKQFAEKLPKESAHWQRIVDLMDDE